MLGSIVLAVLVGLPAPAAPQGAPDSPWLGQWDLDREASSPEANAAYRRIEMTIRNEGPNLVVAYDMVGVRGGRTHLEWTGALDGRDYVVQGADQVITNAYTLTGGASYTIRVRLDGETVASTRVSISEDGDTLTAITTPEGGGASSTSVYRRR